MQCMISLHFRSDLSEVERNRSGNEAQFVDGTAQLQGMSICIPQSGTDRSGVYRIQYCGKIYSCLMVLATKSGHCPQAS